MLLAFIKIAYCISVPLLLLLSALRNKNISRTSVNLLAVSNLLLVGNSIFFWQQLYGFYQLARDMHIHAPVNMQPDYLLAVRILLILILPLLSLVPVLRKNPVFSMVLLALLYSFYTPSTWYLYESGYKVIAYLCLLCAAYALLWLGNLLPYQYPNR
jgi:hypothetical protein